MNVPYAVLDLRFTRFRKGIFAIATSKGQVCLWTISMAGTGPIEHLWTYQIFLDSSLILSLAWSRLPSQSNAIAASSSDGRIAIFESKHEPPVIAVATAAHSLQAWTLAWTTKGEFDLRPELYSGGDDSALCRHELLVRPVSASLNDGNLPSSHVFEFQASLRDTKSHMAGVTAILPLQPIFRGEQLLLTGSYDEYVRLLLPINGSPRPKLLAEQRLGGGVWRLDLLEHEAPDGDWGMQILWENLVPVKSFRSPAFTQHLSIS